MASAQARASVGHHFQVLGLRQHAVAIDVGRGHHRTNGRFISLTSRQSFDGVHKLVERDLAVSVEVAAAEGVPKLRGARALAAASPARGR